MGKHEFHTVYNESVGDFRFVSGPPDLDVISLSGDYCSVIHYRLQEKPIYYYVYTKYNIKELSYCSPFIGLDDLKIETLDLLKRIFNNLEHIQKAQALKLLIKRSFQMEFIQDRDSYVAVNMLIDNDTSWANKISPSIYIEIARHFGITNNAIQLRKYYDKLKQCRKYSEEYRYIEYCDGDMVDILDMIIPECHNNHIIDLIKMFGVQACGLEGKL